MTWLSDWAYRGRVLINSAYVDSDLTHFPVPIILPSGEALTSEIFTELGLNNKKIAITKDDGVTQLYCEVAYWDAISEVATLFVSKTDLVISSGLATRLYVYFDSTKDDNDSYIGLTGSVVAQNVWDSNYAGVFHFCESSGNLLDSTSYNNNGSVSSVPIREQAGSVDLAYYFDGNDDYISLSSAANDELNPDYITIDACIKFSTTPRDWTKIVSKGYDDAYTLQARHSSGSYPSFRIWATGSTAAIATDGVYDNTYHVLTGKYDGTTTSIFVDGAVSNTSGSATGAILADGSAVAIAADPRPGAEMKGYIDEIRFSDIARSDDWIKASSASMVESDFITLYSSTTEEPIISTDMVTNITHNSATLHGSVISIGTELSLDVYFDYGMAESYDLTSAVISVTTTGSIYINISDLETNQLYYYRFVCTNGVEYWYASGFYFNTSADMSIPQDEWVQDNRGAGVWQFSEQEDKWGYLNNPRWSKVTGPKVSYTGRESEEPQIWEDEQKKYAKATILSHIPCGHWHKKQPDIPLEDTALIFGVFNSYTAGEANMLYGVDFDFNSESLTFHGYYQSAVNIIQAINFGTEAESLLTIERTGSNAKLLSLSYTTFKDLVNREYATIAVRDVFSQYDISSEATLMKNATDYYVYSTSHRIVKINHAYTRLAMGYGGTCVLSPSDDALYVLSYIPVLTSPYNHPPDGGSNTYWTYVPDQVTDSPIRPWEYAYAHAARGNINRVYLATDSTYGEHLVIGSNESPYDEYKKIALADFRLLSVNRTSDNGPALSLASPYMFNVDRGISAWSMMKYNYSDFSFTGAAILGAGSPTVTNASMGYEDYALFCTDNGIYSIAADPFSVVADYVTSDGGQVEIIPLKDRYFATAGTNKIVVWYLNEDGTLRLADKIVLGNWGPRAGEIKLASLTSTLQE